jgi:hypothetical protein
MTKDEALRLALEALEKVTKQMLAIRDELAERGGRPTNNFVHKELWDSSFDVYINCAIPTAEAIKAALEAKDEPVAWLNPYGGVLQRLDTGLEKSTYTIPLYTTPPQRTWVGLTDEEIDEGCKQSWVTEQAFQSAVWWAEAKLKEKNT